MWYNEVDLFIQGEFIQQISMFTTEKTPPKTCAFTGHRTLGEDFSPRKLKSEIKKLILAGVDTFYNGMSMGFDLLAAEKTLEAIYKKADEKALLSDVYYRGCMQNRNRYMAERADVLIAYCNKKEGGAAYTVKCFQKLHPEGKVIFV